MIRVLIFIILGRSLHLDSTSRIKYVWLPNGPVLNDVNKQTKNQTKIQTIEQSEKQR